MTHSSQARTRSSIEVTIFGFLVSLTLKSGLDTAYGKTIVEAETLEALWRAVHVPATLHLFIFLFTVIRFIYGAYRYADEVERADKELEGWVRLWSIIGTLVLFV